MIRTVTVTFEVDTDDYDEKFTTDVDLVPLVESMLDGDADLPEEADFTISGLVLGEVTRGRWERRY